mmetsp:Transcript_1382/g.2889  ORF Transcript_1382/g.2889 Transcript_1382/m.2889 type:complete len:86 (+) Transcript_1382:940-1197(+)
MSNYGGEGKGLMFSQRSTNPYTLWHGTTRLIQSQGDLCIHPRASTNDTTTFVFDVIDCALSTFVMIGVPTYVIMLYRGNSLPFFR